MAYKGPGRGMWKEGKEGGKHKRARGGERKPLGVTELHYGDQWGGRKRIERICSQEIPKETNL